MTMTIIGRCTDSGAVGICLASSPYTVGSRCPFVRPGVAVVSTQAFTNPALGPLALDRLAGGASPDAVIAGLGERDPHFGHRQIGIVDWQGRSGAITGAGAKDWKGHVNGENFVAMGNALVGARVVDDIAERFAAGAGLLLEERLMRAIEAGRDAGGEPVGHLSGAIIVLARDGSHPRTDLRVDMAESLGGERADSVDSLRRVLDAFAPLIPFYEQWPKDPAIGSWRDWLATHASG